FFLMVEGSQIDWGGHDNDAAWAMKETEAFEEAFRVAVDFAKRDGRTLVVVTGDHDTGGMSVGGYNEYKNRAEILRNVTDTRQFVTAQIDEKGSNIRVVLKKYAKIDLTDEEEEQIRNAENRKLPINRVISRRVYIGWTST